MKRAPVDVYLGAGSNAEPVANLKLACTELAARYGELSLSPVYRSEPVGFDGDDFLNLVIVFSTRDTLASVLQTIDRIHALAGREPVDSAAAGGHTLDLDLLLFGELVQASGPRLPRADILESAYVLAPLAALAPALRHPETGQTMRELWAAFDQAAHPLTQVSSGDSLLISQNR